MKQKIDELIEKYKKYTHKENKDLVPKEIIYDILSDLEELKKLAEVNSKLTDFVNSQEPMPSDFAKVVDENFWDLI